MLILLFVLLVGCATEQPPPYIHLPKPTLRTTATSFPVDKNRNTAQIMRDIEAEYRPVELKGRTITLFVKPSFV